LGYRITIKTHLGSYVETTEHCDGHDQTTMANLFCIVPMSVLRSEPYNLELLEPIVALVEALNIIGYNWTPSAENTGDAICRTEPLEPAFVVERVHDETTDVYITVSYQNLVADE
jgi:hypothetical protein